MRDDKQAHLRAVCLELSHACEEHSVLQYGDSIEVYVDVDRDMRGREEESAMQVEIQRVAYLRDAQGERHFGFWQYQEQFGRELWLCAYLVAVNELLEQYRALSANSGVGCILKGPPR